MPLDWLTEDVNELLARKKRAKLIEDLRQQMLGRTAPSVNVRLQLCDLLIQAGRGAEAVPVLIGLADEFANDGFVAKAIAILKRVEKMDPGPHVDTRLQRLVEQQRRVTGPVGRRTPGPATPPPAMEAMEAEEPMVVDASELGPPPSLEAEAPAPEDPAPGLPVAEESPAQVADAAPEPEPEPEPPDVEVVVEPPAEPLVEAAAVLEPVVEPDVELPAPPPNPRSGSVGDRIRGAFRRFLATIADAPTPTTPTAEAPVEDPAVEPRVEVPAVEIAPGPEPSAEPVDEPAAPIDAEPVAASAVEDSPIQVTPEVEAESLPEPERKPEVVLSQDAYEDQLIGIVQEVLRRSPATAAAGAVTTVGPEQLGEYATRLLATRLLGPLSQDELMAVVRGLRLHVYEAGDIVVTEGEPGQSLFLVTTGLVKVCVANPEGRNFVVSELAEGEFFGEISSLSGRPRSATVVAATRCELLELDKATVDRIAARYPRVCNVLEAAYIARASSPESAAVRTVALGDGDTQRKALEVLEAHFGDSRWDPRMRLRLADLLLKSGKREEAVPILIGLADELAREGFPERAIAILKKIERVQREQTEEVNLAPLRPAVAPPAAAPAASAASAGPALHDTLRPWEGSTDDNFHGWLVDVVRDTVTRRPAGPAAVPEVRGYGPGVLASPLFEDFTEDELVAFIQGLRLLVFQPGDVIITEGEPGLSLFIVATGSVKVFVRAPAGISLPVGTMGEGAFFGEISTLSGRPRSATVTAAGHCELLEMERTALDAIAADHPRVRTVLEEYSIARASDPGAAAIRARDEG